MSKVKGKQVSGIRIGGVLYTLICGSCKKVQPDEKILEVPLPIIKDPCVFCQARDVHWQKLN